MPVQDLKKEYNDNINVIFNIQSYFLFSWTEFLLVAALPGGVRKEAYKRAPETAPPARTGAAAGSRGGPRVGGSDEPLVTHRLRSLLLLLRALQQPLRLRQRAGARPGLSLEPSYST